MLVNRVNKACFYISKYFHITKDFQRAAKVYDDEKVYKLCEEYVKKYRVIVFDENGIIIWKSRY